MSKIKLSPHASGNGNFTIAAPNSDTSRTIHIPDKDGIVPIGSGTVIQTKVDTSTTQINFDTTTYTDTGVSVTITPTNASNYIYAIWSGQIAKIDSGTSGFGMKIYQDGVAVTNSPADTNGPFDFYKDETRIYVNASKTYYGLAGTTSATTFTFRVRGYYNTQTIQVCHNGSNGSGEENLVVMEIQA